MPLFENDEHELNCNSSLESPTDQMNIDISRSSLVHLDHSYVTSDQFGSCSELLQHLVPLNVYFPNVSKESSVPLSEPPNDHMDIDEIVSSLLVPNFRSS